MPPPLSPRVPIDEQYIQGEAEDRRRVDAESDGLGIDDITHAQQLGRKE